MIQAAVSLAVVAAYLAVVAASRRLRLPAAVSPVLVTALLVGTAVVMTGTPVARFEALAAPLRWLLGPAIVALAAMVHANFPALRRAGAPLAGAILIGTAAGVVTAAAFARMLGLGPLLTAATLTRTITSPFAILVQTRLGGPVDLAAGFAVLTGVIGAVALPPLLRLLGLRGSTITGVAVGVAAHLVGTDALRRRDPAAASIAAVALVAAGILVAVVLPLVARWLIG